MGVLKEFLEVFFRLKVEHDRLQTKTLNIITPCFVVTGAGLGLMEDHLIFLVLVGVAEFGQLAARGQRCALINIALGFFLNVRELLPFEIIQGHVQDGLSMDRLGNKGKKRADQKDSEGLHSFSDRLSGSRHDSITSNA